MRMSDKPITPWIISHKDAKVLAAHCDCMVGLGESCSHVASLLWAVEAGAKKKRLTNCNRYKGILGASICLLERCQRFLVRDND